MREEAEAGRLRGCLDELLVFADLAFDQDRVDFLRNAAGERLAALVAQARARALALAVNLLLRPFGFLKKKIQAMR